MTELLDERQAAKWLHCSVAALRRWRLLRTNGPAFCRIGRLVRYRPEDLAAFVGGCVVRPTGGGR